MKPLVRFLFGYGVPKPPCVPPGATRWRWDILDQIWVPTGEPDFSKSNVQISGGIPYAESDC